MPVIMDEKQNRDFTSMSKWVFILLLLVSCRKSGTQDQNNVDFFPPVNVDFTVNLSLPSYQALTLPNGYAYEANYGYKGVVIYNTGFSGPEQFVAFDRACPYKTDSSCSKVSIDSTNIYLKCGQFQDGRFVSCCNSRFIAQSGGWVDGPAGRGLRPYYVYQFGGNILRITSVPQ